MLRSCVCIARYVDYNPYKMIIIVSRKLPICFLIAVDGAKLTDMQHFVQRDRLAVGRKFFTPMAYDGL